MELENNTLLDHKQPPTTVREVGIHLIYMSREINEIKKQLDSNQFVTKPELVEAIEVRHVEQKSMIEDIKCLSIRLDKIETSFAKIVNKIAATAIGFLVLMLLSLYGLDQFIK